MTVIPATRLARPRWWPEVAAWVLWALTMLGMLLIAWLDQLSRQAGRAEVAQLTPSAFAGPGVAAVSGTTIGAVLASRRPRHPVGWLLLVVGVSLALGGVAPAYAAYGLLARPGALPAAHAVVRYWPVTVVTTQTAFSFVLLLTPTGSLPSPRWRWWARVTVAAAIILLAGLAVASGPLDPRYQLLGGPFELRGQGGVLLVVNQLALAFTTLAVVVGAASLVVRFRRATGVERQQLRWVASAAALAVLGAVVALGGVAVGATAVVTWAISACFAVLPVSIGAAILRYRLYDLDRIISRTLTYGLLTLLLGGGYAAVVLGLGQLLGWDSSLVVAGATLAMAGAFQPARRRVQQLVDRRFNRRRYDAAQTVVAFSARLRDQIDLDTLSAELLSVVEQTVQPTTASLWLRPSRPASSAAGRPRGAPMVIQA
jgi:cytochrome b subunit of formate dehydrogenase